MHIGLIKVRTNEALILWPIGQLLGNGRGPRQRPARNSVSIVGGGVFCVVLSEAISYKVLRTIGSFSRCTPVRDLHTVFDLLYVHNYITKLCRQQVEVIQNHENEHVRRIGQGEARHRRYKRLKLGGGRANDRSSD
jgi:hypothetical protein